MVVNCFQNLYLCNRKQRGKIENINISVVNCFQNLYLCNRKQPDQLGKNFHEVVNCFQNLYLCNRKQLLYGPDRNAYGCELLSKFVFM